MLFYSFGLLAAILIALPYWLPRLRRGGRYRAGLRERLGAISPLLLKFVANRRTIWIHAVSVGEVIASSRLVELLEKFDPDMAVVISTTTRTGQELARRKFDSAQASASRVFYYPLDFAWIVRRYLRALRPCAIVLMESELWPRMLWEAARAEIPVIVVNGRISDRSFPRYRALRLFWKPFLRKLTLVLAQSEHDAERFQAIGVPDGKVQTAGNLKYDVSTPQEAIVTRQLRAHLPPGTQIIVAGSTLEGEEKYLLDAFREQLPRFPNTILILAPRHPERFQPVETLIKERGFPCLRKSDWISQPVAIATGSVFLLDSMGELASVYSLASVAFVGGSLVPSGGHNPLEPAQFGVPVAMGPHTENFRGMVAVLLSHEAIRICPPERLAGVWEELLASPDSTAMGRRAQQVFRDHSGASERCADAIAEILAANGNFRRNVVDKK